MAQRHLQKALAERTRDNKSQVLIVCKKVRGVKACRVRANGSMVGGIHGWNARAAGNTKPDQGETLA